MFVCLLLTNSARLRFTGYTACPEKNEPLNIFVLASENCPELNIAKPASIWVTVPKFGIIPPYHLTDFQFLQTHFPTLFTNFLTHGAYGMHDCQAVLINKMLPEEDRVLIKVLRVEKGYGTKQIMNKFT